MSFLMLEIIQFVVGLLILIICYTMIAYHRRPVLNYIFGDDVQTRKSFVALTAIGYFLIFIPVLLFGLDLEEPSGYNIIKHIQNIIYFEAGLIFVIGILHFLIMILSSTKIKFEKKVF